MTKRNLKWTSVLITALLCMSMGDVLAEVTCKDVQKNHFVEVLSDGEKRSGTGVILTSDGYILTAFHVIEGFLEVAVRFHGAENPVPADVIGVDDYFDMALLKALGKPGQFQNVLVVHPANAPQVIEKLCHWGYGIHHLPDGTRQLEPLNFVELAFRERAKGFTYVEGKLKSGFSGGGALIDGKLYGINLVRSEFGTRILPIKKIAPFLVHHGLEILQTGFIKSSPGFSGLLQLTNNNRYLIDRILRSVNWNANLPFLLGNHDQQGLTIWFERNFPAQEVRGFFDGHAVPLFAQDDFKVWVGRGNLPMKFPVHGNIKSDGTIVIPNFVSGLRSLSLRYLDDHELRLDHRDLLAIEINGQIRSSGGDRIGAVTIHLDAKKDPSSEQ